MSLLTLTTPRFGLAMGLVIWGAFTGHLAPALGMAVIAEYPRLSGLRWDIEDKQFYRAADVSAVVFAVVAVLQFNEYSLHGIYKILELLPYCLFPLVLVQAFATHRMTPMSALFMGVRREVRRGRRTDSYVNTAPAYMVACLLAASSAPTPGYRFLGVAVAGVLGLLLAARPTRYRYATWAGVITLAFGIAFLAQGGARLAQRQIEGVFAYWLDQYAWLRPDPDRAITAIGSIGRLKFSDRIRVRVSPSKAVRVPLLLQEASYASFNLGIWSVTDSRYEALDAQPGDGSWRWAEDAGFEKERLEIAIEHRHDLGVVPLPRGTSMIKGPDIVEVQRNEYGTTLVEAKPGHLHFTASFSRGRDLEPTARASDLVIPEHYRSLVIGIARELSLEQLDDSAAIGAVRDYFARNFKYSLVQKGFYPGKTPLAHFLTQNRRGHCEYFATSTVLLLRAAGIPARYAVGYAVQEFSGLEGAWVARARHAHSWALAYVDGRWRPIDTTPAQWYELENEAASGWQTWQDLWAWLGYRLQRLRHADKEELTRQLSWLVPPLVILLIWRLRRYARPAAATPHSPAPMSATSGADSDLYAVVADLAARGLSPAAGDTLQDFLLRHAPGSHHGVDLRPLIALHYKYRFGPRGLSTGERVALRRDVAGYLGAGQPARR